MDNSQNQRFRVLLEYLREKKLIRNQQDFTERIGSDKSTVSQIVNNHIGIPNGLFGCVVAAFPFVNELWLRSGDGEMIKPSAQQSSYVNNSPIVMNSDNNQIGNCAPFNAALAEIAEQRKLVERSLSLLAKRDEQIDRLLTIIETRNTDK